jgi:predicted transposase/invertase (TIGR01784 family)
MSSTSKFQFNPLSPKSDVVFKRLFGDRRNVELLKDFLVATLDIPVCDYETVEIIDPQLKRERPGDKLGILDVLIKTKQGKFIDVEIQVDETNNMPERVTYYAAKLLASQLAAGQEYDSDQAGDQHCHTGLQTRQGQRRLS